MNLPTKFHLGEEIVWSENLWKIVAVRKTYRPSPGNFVKGWDYILENQQTKVSIQVDEKDLEKAIIFSTK